MTDISEKTRKRLEALRRAYVEQLPARVQAIEESWSGLRCGQWSMETLSELSRQVHGLAGSGATFGYAEISDKAHRLELVMDEIMESGGNPGANREGEVECFLEGLKKACLDAIAESLKPSSAERKVGC